MAYTRRWTRDEDRILRKWYRGKRDAGRVARKVHRTPFAVVERAKMLKRAARLREKPRYRPVNLENRLPPNVQRRDPRGIWCGTCDQELHFFTEDGRLYQRCGCQIARVPTRKP